MTKENLHIQLHTGLVVIEFREDLAPLHVERIKTLTREGLYDDVAFHRVIANFMAQTGDVEHSNLAKKDYNPDLLGTGGSKLPDLKQEFSKTTFVRGVCGMARKADVDSANSQFFITYGEADFLDGFYTVWGQVISGMDFVDNIVLGEPPKKPDRMLTVRLVNAE